MSPVENDPLDAARHLYTEGELSAAATAYRAAQSEGADPSQCQLGLGLIAIDQDQPIIAIDHLKKSIAADHTNLGALTALGAAFALANLPAKAATVLVEAVRRAPETLEPRLQLARAFSALNRFGDALTVLTESVENFEQDAAFWRLKGKVERRANKLHDSYESFERVCTLCPNDADALNDLGVICRALGRYDDAERHYRQALSRSPDLAMAHANLGNVLDLQGQVAAAEASLRAALALSPENPDFAYNLAAVLSKLERPDEAVPLLESVTRLEPDRWDAWTNLGVAHLDCGDIESAETTLRHALEINPENPEAHYNLAWLLLLTDRHEEGWQELEWRWQLEEFSSTRRQFDYPLWNGNPLGDQTLLLHAEQGFGDTIQFCRFAADIPKQSGRIILECQTALVSLLEGIDGVDEIIPAGSALPAADVHAPLLSLPHLTRYTGARSTHSQGYLETPPTLAKHLLIPNAPRRRIGLVWAGSPDNKIERRRHINPEMFAQLFNAIDADFVSLQTGPRSGDEKYFAADRMIFSCEDTVDNFADTAAVIQQLDLVIGVDTAVMHLAGALGKPAWILLPFMPDYRWGLGRNISPWYDSVRLFRQHKRNDWSAVFAELCAALRSW